MNLQLLAQGAIDCAVDVVGIAAPSSPFDDPLVKAADRQLDGLLKSVAADREFTGRPGQIVFVPTGGKLPSKYIALLGAGPRSSPPSTLPRDLAARLVKQARQVRASSVALVLPRQSEARHGHALQQAAMGAALGDYQFGYKASEKKASLNTFLVSDDRSTSKKAAAKKRGTKTALARASAISEAVCRARDWVNEPAVIMTPQRLAKEARALANKHGVAIKVLSAKECEKHKMGLFLAVARGSAQPAQFIHMTYKPKGKAKQRVALIGKGITFDSGGYSLKTSAGMFDMKTDMAGAAAVISAMGALSELRCKHEVHAIVPTCENMVSGDANRLGDVLRAMDGTTVEVNNTDAEGRLILGDALTYARKVVKPDHMIDFATLTGASMVALGPYIAGVFSEDDALANALLRAGDRAGEEYWRLPVATKLKYQLKSPIADMKNSGERYGGALTAGLFLRNFAKDTPWVHVDMAGPSSVSREHEPHLIRGGTGFGVATILEYLSE